MVGRWAKHLDIAKIYETLAPHREAVPGGVGPVEKSSQLETATSTMHAEAAMRLVELAGGRVTLPPDLDIDAPTEVRDAA